MKNNPVCIAVLSLIAMGAAIKSSAITLGGKNVSKDHFIVYLGIGHCNFAGRNVTTADSVTNPNCWYYRWQTDSTWALAKEHNGGDPSGGTAIGFSGLTSRGTGGPSMPFLKGMAAAHSGYYFGIIENGLSRAQIRRASAPNPTGVPSGFVDTYWKSGGSLYSEIINLAKKVAPDVTFGGIICMLGYTEGCYDNKTADASTTKSDLVQLVNDMRTDLGMPNLPFLINSYERGATGCFLPTYTSASQNIVRQIDSLPKALTYCDTVGNSGCTYRDDHHFNTAGENLWASRVVAKITQRGWFPAGTSTTNYGHMGMRSFRVEMSLPRNNSMQQSVVFTFESCMQAPVIAVFNGEGKLLSGRTISMGGKVRFDFAEKVKGVCFVKISSDGMTVSRKLMMPF